MSIPEGLPKDKLLPDKIKNKLYYLLQTTKNLLEKNKITYFAEGGTLLGAIRHKEMVPWDDDMDIGILDPDDKIESVLDKLPKDLKYVPIFFGYKVFFRRGGKKLYKRGHLQNYKYPALDIFTREIVNKRLVYKTEKSREIWTDKPKTDIYFPLKTYRFGPLKIKGANKPEKYLDQLFGKKPDWRTTGVIRFNHSTERWLKTPIVFKLN